LYIINARGERPLDKVRHK